MSSPLLTVEDVAARLSVSDSFVYEAVAAGRLKHYRLGKGQGAIRVSEEQLSEFLRLSERGGAEAAPQPPQKVTTRARQKTFTFLPPPT